MSAEAKDIITTPWVDQTVRYYVDSPSYLTGPLRGTCHFGYTPTGQRFNLRTDLRAMERLLGQTLDLPAGSPVVDAGCGFGRVSTTLAREFGYNMIGVDLIPDRLAEARRYTELNDVADKVTLLHGNYGNTQLPDASVAGVFTMETLVHADPLEDVLAEFWRMLQPGGKLVLFEYNVPDQSSLDPVRKYISENMIRRTGMASIHRFTPGALPNILEQANFQDVQVRDISRNVWPSWEWLFKRAIKKDWPRILRGDFRHDTNLAGSLLIYPYRHFLGYDVVSATKPKD